MSEVGLIFSTLGLVLWPLTEQCEMTALEKDGMKKRRGRGDVQH